MASLWRPPYSTRPDSGSMPEIAKENAELREEIAELNAEVKMLRESRDNFKTLAQNAENNAEDSHAMATAMLDERKKQFNVIVIQAGYRIHCYVASDEGPYWYTLKEIVKDWAEERGLDADSLEVYGSSGERLDRRELQTTWPELLKFEES